MASAAVNGSKRVARRQGATFEVDPHYDISKRIGQGSFGLIAEATDERTGEIVAVKKIRQAFEHTVECRRTLREIRLLRHFEHENIMRLKDIMLPPAGREWMDVYLVMDRMDTDLHYIIHSKQSLTSSHVKWFMFQILRGLAHIHAASVMHRDLKPSNILVNSNCDLKICDFGLARGVDDPATPPKAETSPLTEYVVTRYYRAPELLVLNASYGREVDLWSVGCILAECLGRRYLFPGRDYLHQLRLIVEHLGMSKTDLGTIENENARDYVAALAPPSESAGSSVNWAEMYPQAEVEALDMLSLLLRFDARQRINAASALDQAYLREIHLLNPCAAPPPPFRYDFEECGVGESELRALIWREVSHFHPNQVDEEPPEAFTSCVMPMPMSVES